jgi:predicted MFS family arabinose efflux permease
MGHERTGRGTRESLRLRSHPMSRAAHADDRPGRAGRQLFITGLGIGQICSWGSLYYSFPLIAEAMRNDLGWSKPDLYGAATLGLLLSGLAAYPIGSAIDRGHGRGIMAVASVLAGILLVAWSQVENIAVLYILLAGIGCLQAAVLTEAAFALVSRRFGAADARGGILTLSLWAGFASTVFIPLIQLLLDHFGWRETLMILGGVNIVLCGGLYATVIDPAADASPQTVDQPGSRPMAGVWAVGWALKSPIFWALAIALTAYWAVFSAFIFHAYPLLLERGFDTQAVVFAMAIIGPAQVAGRLAIWVLARGVQIRVIGSLVVLAFPLVFLGLMVTPPLFPAVALIAATYGAANGIMTIVRGLVVPEMLTPDAYGAINGALAVPTIVAKAAAPFGAALLWAASGSYVSVLIALLGGSLLLIIAFWVSAFLAAHRDRTVSIP